MSGKGKKPAVGKSSGAGLETLISTANKKIATEYKVRAGKLANMNPKSKLFAELIKKQWAFVSGNDTYKGFFVDKSDLIEMYLFWASNKVRMEREYIMDETTFTGEEIVECLFGDEDSVVESSKVGKYLHSNQMIPDDVWEELSLNRYFKGKGIETKFMGVNGVCEMALFAEGKKILDSKEVEPTIKQYVTNRLLKNLRVMRALGNDNKGINQGIFRLEFVGENFIEGVRDRLNRNAYTVSGILDLCDKALQEKLEKTFPNELDILKKAMPKPKPAAV